MMHTDTKHIKGTAPVGNKAPGTGAPGNEPGNEAALAAGDTCLVLTAKEFAILAASIRIKSFYGPDLHAGAMEEEEVLSCLCRMAQKGIIREENEVFHVTEPYSSLFASIKNAGSILVIRPAGRNLQSKCVYFGEESWMIETDGYSPSRIRCRRTKADEIADILYTQDYLPHLVSDHIAGEDDLSEDNPDGYAAESVVQQEGLMDEQYSEGEWEPSGKLPDTGEMLSDPDCRLVAEKRGRIGDNYVKVRQLIVRRQPTGYRMEVLEEGRRRDMPYSRKAFEAGLESL